ncbi:Putative expansin [Seminavis robusta]|uniref:Expansin n=1 Tax=Seminavis robusta TaxID=568900 RepID=A0A9N8HXX9_9STRA|nr:Putative expansin [Seminavis robusta]|eukprot:Sro2339_g323990.1 Putative expansin (448) ;mRNA; f:11569-13564
MVFISFALALTLLVDVASAATSGKATYYGGNVAGNACGFNSMNTGSFPYGFGAAIGGNNFDSGYGCGSCYQIRCIGPYGSNPSCFCDPDHPTVTVWANDQCPECGDDHIDLNTEAMEYIVADGLAGTCGEIEIEFEQVNCDFDGNLEVRSKSGTGPYWYGLHLDNVAGYGAISSVTLEEEGNLHSCDKAGGPSFWQCYLVNTPATVPMDVTLVDQGGRYLTCSGCIDNFNGDTSYDFGSNYGSGLPTGSLPTGPTGPSSPATPTRSPTRSPTRTPTRLPTRVPTKAPTPTAGSTPTAATPTGGSTPTAATPTVPSSPTDSTPTSPPIPNCFSQTATVDVLDKGKVALKDLQVNDWVATGAATESEGCRAVGPRGHHPVVDHAIELVRWAEQQNVGLQWAVFGLCLVVMLVFTLVEKLWLNTTASSFVVAMAVAAATHFYGRKKGSQV